MGEKSRKDQALYYAEKMGWAVFPVYEIGADGACTCGGAVQNCKPGKHPRLPNGLHGASKDRKLIAEWWARWPQANIGVATGAVSGIFVVDVDVSGDKVGHDSIKALEASIPGGFPQTAVQGTGSGGLHYFFKHPGGRMVNTGGKRLGKDLDARGDGGYVLVPGSNHASGGRYHWVEGNEPWTRGMADAPDELVAKLRPAEAKPVERNDTFGVTDAQRSYAQKALEDEAAIVAGCGAGGRNDTLNSAALKMGRLVAAGALDGYAVEAALMDAAAACGLNRGEAKETFGNGFKAGLKQPRDLSEIGQRPERSERTVSAPKLTAETAPTVVLPDDEALVLAMGMTNEVCAATIVDKLTPDHFTDPVSQVVFMAIRSLFGRKAVNLMTVRSELLSQGAFNEQVWVKLTEFAGIGGSVDMAEEGVSRLQEARMRRDLHASLMMAAQRALDPECADPASEAMGLLLATTSGDPGGDDFPTLEDYMQENYARDLDRADRIEGGEEPWFTTGFQEIDDKLVCEDGAVIVMGGRSGMGKTALAMAIVRHVASRDLPVIVFSLEMPGHSIARRELTASTGIGIHKQIRCDLDKDEWGAYAKELTSGTRRNIVIDRRGSLTVPQMQAYVKRYALRHRKPGLVVIDYVQIVSAVNRKLDGHHKFAEISRMIKQMALELDLPVVALSQLNRASEKDTDKKPKLNSLRESGALEADADVVLLLYRDDYYKGEASEKPGVIEVDFAKHRNGATGIVELDFEKERMTFTKAAQRPVKAPETPIRVDSSRPPDVDGPDVLF